MKIFETNRLYGREFCESDFVHLTEILSDPEVMRYSVRGVCDEDATRKFIQSSFECYSSQEIGMWAIIEKSSGELIGFCGVGPEVIDEVEQINLGYRLAKKFWNLGLATEAVKGVLDYAFGQKSLATVVAVIEPENMASLRVVEKAGFSDFTNSVFHDRSVRLYTMTIQGWQVLRQNIQQTSL
ncbi:MAG: GNAT family N-acetyltransferase [Candidatus Thiodiazotropha sp. DIVDIV]